MSIGCRHAVDVAFLRALVPPAEQDHHGRTLAAELDPEPRPEVDAQLEDAVAHGARVAEVPQSEPGDALPDAVAGCPIAESSEPFGEGLAAVRAGVDPDLLLGRHPARVA